MNNPNLRPKRHAYKKLFGQVPLTRFKDYRNSVKVELIKSDDPLTMKKGVYEFVKATWSEDGDEASRATDLQMTDAMNQMLSGKTLGLGLETINLMFKIKGISRIDTHQIVRQRIGVTFSQQCSGDRFLYHNDVLVEECINKNQELLDKFIITTLNNKMTYAKLIDEGISIQTAREILPHNLETFIFMNTNLATLLFFYQKRIEVDSQTWSINEVAKQMADEVIKQFPETEVVFKKFSKKFTLQRDQSVDRENQYSSSLYLPDVDDFEYHERDFLYQKTKKEMIYTNTPIKDKFFYGYVEINEDLYNTIKNVYELFDKVVHSHNWSNDEIKQKALELNASIEAKYNEKF